MTASEQTNLLLPAACLWAEEQEKFILENGTRLSPDQEIDAFLIGVKDPKLVRLLPVGTIPLPEHPELKTILNELGFAGRGPIGLTLRYGIYIKQEYSADRRLIAHELAHTMQYERLGGFANFLRQYITECMTVGYPFGALEREASVIEKKITGQ